MRLLWLSRWVRVSPLLSPPHTLPEWKPVSWLPRAQHKEETEMILDVGVFGVFCALALLAVNLLILRKL